MTTTRQRSMPPQDIATELLTDHFGGGLHQSLRRLEQVQTILASEALLKQVPNIARAAEVWDQLPKDADTKAYVYNDLDCRVNLETSENGKRLVVGHENISVGSDDARGFVFWLESGHDLRTGQFDVDSLDRMAVFRMYPSYEAFEQDNIVYENDWREAIDVGRYLSTPEATRKASFMTGKPLFPGAPKFGDFSAKLNDGETLPSAWHADAGLYDINLAGRREELDKFFGSDGAFNSLQGEKRDEMRRDIEQKLYEDLAIFAANPTQLYMMVSSLSGMRCYMDNALECEAENNASVRP